jgi:hypothetical protein
VPALGTSRAKSSRTEDAMQKSRHVVGLVITFASLAACSADDAAPINDGGAHDSATHSDAQRSDAQTVPGSRPVGACGGTSRSLSSARAEVIFVIDRSSSMTEPGTDAEPKWTELTRSLATVLPSVEARISMGLVAFPAPLDPGDVAPTVAAACGTLSRVDVAPQFANSHAVLTVLQQTSPGGATPTNSALQLAAQYYQTEPDTIGSRYLVLATDGGPNCTTALDPSSCRCSGPPDVYCRNPANPYARTNCLDDARTVATIASLATQGVHTFVVGLPGTESFTDVLDAMAVAGGRPREGTPRYYDASSTQGLIDALSAITSGIVDCRFELTAAPPDPTQVDVRLGATSLPYDVRHRDGWDWADANHREIVFYGAACDAVQSATGGEQLVAAFGCPPTDAPP